MSCPYRRIIFLAGAPECHVLDWDEETLLPATERVYHLTRYLSGDSSCPEREDGTEQASDQDLPPWMKKPSMLQSAWRALPLYPQHLPTGFSPGTPWQPSPSLPEVVPGSDQAIAGSSFDAETSFLTTSDLSLAVPTTDNREDALPARAGTASFGSSDDEILSQFYEHFLAVHQGIATSQIVPSQGTPPKPGSAQSNGEPCSRGSSDGVTSSDPFSPLNSPARKPEVRHVTDVRDIPNASYLDSIIPQTMTVNLVVAIIGIGADRVVRTRRGGSEMHVVELLTGDESRTGFGINLWLLPPQTSTAPKKRLEKAAGEHALAASLRGLRVQDIILARNVALSSFRGRVFGQSLRRGMTRLELLHRRYPFDGPSQDSNGRRYGLYHPSELGPTSTTDPLSQKLRRVRDWLVHFVGAEAPTASAVPYQGPKREGAKGKAAPSREVLPPDTP